MHEKKSRALKPWRRSFLSIVAIVCLLFLTPRDAEGQVLIRRSEPEVVHEIIEDRDKITWILEQGRLLSTADGRNVNVVVSAGHAAPSEFYCLHEVDGAIWIGTNQGLYSLQNGSMLPLQLGPGSRVPTYFILEDTALRTTFVGTRSGLYTWVPGSTELAETEVLGVVTFVGRVHGAVWASSFAGTYRYKDGAFEAFTSPNSARPLTSAVDILWARGKYYFNTGSIRGRGRAFDLFRSPDHLETPWKRGVLDIGIIDDDLWFSRGNVVFSTHTNADEVKRFVAKSHVTFIGESGSRQWITSKSEVYWRERGVPAEWQLIARKYEGLDIGATLELQSGSWLFGENGAFRLYPEVRIAADMNISSKSSNIFRRWVFGRELKIDRAFYEKGGAVWFSGGEETFEAILETDAGVFWERLEKASFRSLKKSAHVPRQSLSRVRLSVQDQYGNIQSPEAYNDLNVVSLWNLWVRLLRAAIYVTVGSLLLLAAAGAWFLPPLWRLRCYFWFQKVPVLGNVASPSFAWSRRLLRHLHTLLVHDRNPGAVSEPVSDFLAHLGDRSDRIGVLPSGNVTLSRLEQETLLVTSPPFRESFPVPIPYGDLTVAASASAGDLKNYASQYIENLFPDAPSAFLLKFLGSSNFLFLISKAGPRHPYGTAASLQRICGKGSWVVFD